MLRFAAGRLKQRLKTDPDPKSMAAWGKVLPLVVNDPEQIELGTPTELNELAQKAARFRVSDAYDSLSGPEQENFNTFLETLNGKIVSNTRGARIGLVLTQRERIGEFNKDVTYHFDEDGNILKKEIFDLNGSVKTVFPKVNDDGSLPNLHADQDTASIETTDTPIETQLQNLKIRQSDLSFTLASGIDQDSLSPYLIDGNSNIRNGFEYFTDQDGNIIAKDPTGKFNFVDLQGAETGPRNASSKSHLTKNDVEGSVALQSKFGAFTQNGESNYLNGLDENELQENFQQDYTQGFRDAERYDMQNEDYNVESVARARSAEVEKCKISEATGAGLANCDTTERVVQGAKVYKQVGEAAVGFGVQIQGARNQAQAVQENTGSATYNAAAKNHQFTATARAIQGAGDLFMAMWQSKRKQAHKKSARKSSEAAAIAKDNNVVRAHRNSGGYSSAGDPSSAQLSNEAGRLGTGQHAESKEGSAGYVTAHGATEGAQMAKSVIQNFKMNEKGYRALTNVEYRSGDKEAVSIGDCKTMFSGPTMTQCMKTIARLQGIRNREYKKKRYGIQSKVEDVSLRAAGEQKRNQNEADAGMWGSIFSGVQNMAQSAFGFMSAKELRKSARALDAAEKAYVDSRPDLTGDPLPGGQPSNRGFEFQNDQSSDQIALSEQIDDNENDPNLGLGDPFDPFGDDNITVGETPTPGTFNPADQNPAGGGGGGHARHLGGARARRR